MAAVLDLDPVLLPASAIWPIAESAQLAEEHEMARLHQH
jgi:hypothetical protein